MIDNTFQFAFRELNLTVAQAESDMGYRQEAPDEAIKALISEVMTECETLSNIKAEYRIFDNIQFDESGKTVKINNLVFNINKTVYSQLKKSQSLAVFLCTAGEDIGIRSKKATEDGDPLKAYIYDVIGSEIVEAASEIILNELDKGIIPLGLKTTNSFNPGYCGWDVAEQHKLFHLVPGDFCGIRLTESALMDPVKSGSGFIGIGKEVKRVPYTCSFCDMKDCFYRRD